MGTAAQVLIGASEALAAAGITVVGASSLGVFNLSLTASVTRTVGAGNGLILIIGHYAYDSSGTTFSIADTNGTWGTPDASEILSATQNVITSLQPATAGSHTVTVTALTGNAANSVGAIQLLEVSGMATSPFDQKAGASANNTAPATGNTPALSTTGQLLVAALAAEFNAAGFTTPPTGGPGTYTNTATGTLDTDFVGDYNYQLNGGMAAVDADWGTLSTVTNWGALIATYKPAGAPPPPPSYLYPRRAIQSQGSAPYPNGAAAPANITYCTHNDVVIFLDNQEGSSTGNGYVRETVVATMTAGDGTVTPTVQQYQVESFNDQTTAGGGGSVQNQPTFAALIVNGWYLTRPELAPCNPTTPYSFIASISSGSGTLISGSLPPVGALLQGSGITPYTEVTAASGLSFTVSPSQSVGAESMQALSNCDASAVFHSTLGGENYWQLNYASMSLDSNGLTLEGEYGNYFVNYWLGGTNANADRAPSLGGPWHDNVFGTWPSNLFGDYLQTGSGSQGGQDITAATAIRAGQVAYAARIRALSPGKLIMGNIAVLDPQSDDPGVPLFQRAPSVLTSLNGLYDGLMVESCFGGGSTEHYNGFAGVVQLMQYDDAITRHPELNQYTHYNIDSTGNDPDFPNGSVGSGTGGVNGTPGQAVRYSRCAVLVTAKGCWAPLQSASIGGIADTFGWYDYDSVSISGGAGTAVNYQTQQSSIGPNRYWLNTPLDAPQTAGTVGNTGLVWARRYTLANGHTALVLVNPSSNANGGAAVQTVSNAQLAALSLTSSGTWNTITATSGGTPNNDANATINSGTSITSVTIAVGDGIILIQ